MKITFDDVTTFFFQLFGILFWVFLAVAAISGIVAIVCSIIGAAVATTIWIIAGTALVLAIMSFLIFIGID